MAKKLMSKHCKARPYARYLLRSAYFKGFFSQRTNAPNAMSMHTVKTENVFVMEVIMGLEYEENVSVLEVRSSKYNKAE